MNPVRVRRRAGPHPGASRLSLPQNSLGEGRARFARGARTVRGVVQPSGARTGLAAGSGACPDGGAAPMGVVREGGLRVVVAANSFALSNSGVDVRHA
jgi:hypothetical protein